MKRFKVHTITSKNRKWIFSRIHKFVEHRDFLMWHQFDGGMRKRMKTSLIHRSSMNFWYKSVLKVLFKKSVRSKTLTTESGQEVLKIYTGRGNDGFTLKDGDKVAFLGNRILFSNSWGGCTGMKENIFVCLQINK